MDISRNKIQEMAVQVITAALISRENDIVFDVMENISDVTGLPYEDSPLYLKELVINSLKNERLIEEDLSKYLKNWKFSRLNFCIQAILIVAVTNFKYVEERVDKAVVINVAVELAKKYGDDKDYKFVNAILDNALKNE